MQVSASSNLFSFREVNFMESHHTDLSHGIKRNHICYIKKGCVDIVTEKETLHLQEGDIFHVPRGTKYHSYWKGEPDISFNSYAYMNYPGKKPGTTKMQEFKTTPKILELIDMIPTDNVINCYSVGLFYLLLNELIESIEESNKSDEQILLDKAMIYIQENPDCLIPDVAYHCNISESGLYMLFKTHSDITPAKFKLSVKLDKALDYLVSTDIPIEQISGLCGFSSPSYFRKNFCKVYKKSPREMRKNAMI